MKRIHLLTLLILTSLLGYGQGKYKVSYEELKEYQGLYQYQNNSTLHIAASPKDTLLYAIINESRYQLMPVEKDLFLNMTKDRVEFFRDKQNKVAGYTVGKDRFAILSRNVVFPKEMWYPRLTNLQNYTYTYRQPTDDNDGLKAGSLENTDLDKSLLDEMMKKIIEGEYPNVHSVLILKTNLFLKNISTNTTNRSYTNSDPRRRVSSPRSRE
ncbi:hypothetical protein MASR1M31_08110 [Porphyromonadaceae bacterium]